MVPSIFLTDAYKLDHRRQYPEGTTEVYSNLTARQSRVDDINEVVFFGLQYYIKRYLQEEFDLWFSTLEDEAVEEYESTVKAYLGPNALGGDFSHIRDLHRLQYLPIKLKALAEGAKVKIGVPVLTIVNTLPKFFWLTNYLETSLSNTIWLPITSATTALQYRGILDRAYKGRDENEWFKDWQCHDFSYRGMSSLESACLSGAAHLLSFKGSDTVPAVPFLKQYYSVDEDTIIAGSIAACFPEGAELLTDKGFKLFEDLDEGDLVAQVDKGVISFVCPTAYHEYSFEGNLINFRTGDLLRYVDFTVTPNHRVLGVTAKGGNYIIKEASDYNFSGLDHKLVISGIKDGDITLSPFERLLIAFQADGSFSSRSSHYTGMKEGTIAIRFSLKKDRKADRLREIIKECNFEYSESKYDNGYYSFRVAIPVTDLLRKDFSWVELKDVGTIWAKEFIEELQFWDGSLPRPNTLAYSSTNKDTIDTVMALCVIAECKSQLRVYKDPRVNRKPCYSLTINFDKTSICGTKIEKTEIYYNGLVRCVSVPSGLIVVRQNDRVIVTGNSEHSVMMASGDDKETFTRLLTEVYPKDMVSIVSDTWDLWHVVGTILPEIKDLIMSREGKLVVRPDSGSPLLILCGDEKAETELEKKGLIEALWDIFGGTTNKYGYKVLDSHIGAIYGDSITPERAKSILFFLARKGFAPSNVVFGIGSFSYQYATRDQFGMALKATSVVINGERRAIFKDPKTSKDTNKKSARGLLRVEATTDRGDFILIEDVTEEEEQGGALKIAFSNGAWIPSYDNSLEAIRARVTA